MCNVKYLAAADKALRGVVSWIGGAAFLVLMFYICASVIARFFGQPWKASLEVSSLWIMVLAVSAAFVLAAMNGSHLVVTLVTDRIQKTSLKWFSAVSLAVTSSFLLVLFYLVGDDFLNSLMVRQLGSETGWPLWPSKLLLVIALGGLLCYVGKLCRFQTESEVVRERIVHGGEHDSKIGKES